MTPNDLHPAITAQLKAAEQAETELRIENPAHYATALGLDPSQPTPHRVRLDLMQRHEGNFRPGAPRTPTLRSVVVALPGREQADPELTERVRRMMEVDVIASQYLDNMTDSNLRVDPNLNGDLTTPGWWVRATPLEGAPLSTDDLRRLWNAGYQIEGRSLLSAVQQLMKLNLTPRESLHVEAGLSRIVMRQHGWHAKGGGNEYFFMLALRPDTRADVSQGLNHYSSVLQGGEERDYPEDNHLLPFMVGWINGTSLVEGHTVMAGARAEAEQSLRLYDDSVRAITALDHRGSTYEQLQAILAGTSRYAPARNGRPVKDSEAEQLQDHMLRRNDTPDPSNLN